MANTRSHRTMRSVAKTSSSRKPQQRKMPRLFQNPLLTGLFGRSVGTLVTRSVLTVVVIGVLAFIVAELLRPSAASDHPNIWGIVPACNDNNGQRKDKGREENPDCFGSGKPRLTTPHGGL